MENLVINKDIFSGIYSKRRVLVIGNTGFKGSWLSLWLGLLNAEVAGFSLYLPSDPCNFAAISMDKHMDHTKGDIRNISELEAIFSSFKPEIVFHLAAQPIVRRSYDDPKLTFDTNLGGTVNILECIKTSTSVKAAVIITSDKCYENAEWDYGYREIDRLGGKDPYSVSKACADIATSSYIRSFFTSTDSPNIAIARAGNVIGGGDWGENRIITSCVESWSRKEKAEIRSPEATRPWQHVLEPLSGYLQLGSELLQGNVDIIGEAFNFGPDNSIMRSVKELVDTFSLYWEDANWIHVSDNNKKGEAKLLKLCCDKALSLLDWKSILSFEEVLKKTAKWYRSYYNNEDVFELACVQIKEYVEKGTENNMRWSRG